MKRRDFLKAGAVGAAATVVPAVAVAQKPRLTCFRCKLPISICWICFDWERTMVKDFGYIPPDYWPCGQGAAVCRECAWSQAEFCLAT